jgi:hypothetical protein
MLLRTALIGVLFAACAHAPAEKPAAQSTPPAAATPPPAATPPAVSAPAETASAPLASLPAAPPVQATTAVEFARDVRPILESRCQPCHFAGGRMYDRLPFDRPETIRQLGPKLFTRIKDESSRATINAFLSQAQ